MIRAAGMLMKQFNIDFIATGEVMGQRSSSENADALKKVQASSGYGQFLIRPLSAKLLHKNEAYKFVDVEKLCDIQGRTVER